MWSMHVIYPITNEGDWLEELHFVVAEIAQTKRVDLDQIPF